MKKPKPQRHPIPFDDALRRILAAPPQHKVTKKKLRKKPSGAAQ